MKRLISMLVLAAFTLGSLSVHAQAPASTPDKGTGAETPKAAKSTKAAKPAKKSKKTTKKTKKGTTSKK